MSNQPEDSSGDFDSSDLLKEKSLYAIWKKCRRLPRNWFNGVATVLVALLLTLHVSMGSRSISDTADEIRSICDLGVGFGASILGFLLAGFTIFATMTKPDLMIRMARRKHEGSGLSFLKYNYFALMEVFILFTCFVAMCLIGRLVLARGGGISAMIDEHTVNPALVRCWLVRVGFVFLGTAFVYLLLALKSFTFNIYHITMTGLKWEMVRDEERAERRARKAAKLNGGEQDAEAEEKTVVSN
ncbi:MAG: hypothetical protein M1133_02420 [Armatimonadetes bacterium]|nr:hypothetical protein [Armatimonadota bacterium]